MTRYAALLLVLALAVPVIALAAVATSGPHQLPGIQGLEVTLDADGATELTTDDASHGLAGKRAFFFQMDTDGDGTDEHLLVRIQQAPNGLWIDLVADTSVANVDSRVAAMDLSSAQGNHPSPTEDAADTEAITAAGS
jgi:hypothetical protein